ncbi:hypothetical protein EVAR_83811_1 [Eumeta japonica]|uniref:Uncharacterized protein n=1 Tax=Eumeta variegata TaxID=151549 RepID=A0A4C1WH68_EUMVA|nr:hypothetical protein EVAR_83811_1 [Eumeta japonica]
MDGDRSDRARTTRVSGFSATTLLNRRARSARAPVHGANRKRSTVKLHMPLSATSTRSFYTNVSTLKSDEVACARRPRFAPRGAGAATLSLISSYFIAAVITRYELISAVIYKKC